MEQINIEIKKPMELEKMPSVLTHSTNISNLRTKLKITSIFMFVLYFVFGIISTYFLITNYSAINNEDRMPIWTPILFSTILIFIKSILYTYYINSILFKIEINESNYIKYVLYFLYVIVYGSTIYGIYSVYIMMKGLTGESFYNEFYKYLLIVYKSHIYYNLLYAIIMGLCILYFILKNIILPIMRHFDIPLM